MVRCTEWSFSTELHREPYQQPQNAQHSLEMSLSVTDDTVKMLSLSLMIRATQLTNYPTQARVVVLSAILVVDNQ